MSYLYNYDGDLNEMLGNAKSQTERAKILDYVQDAGHINNAAYYTLRYNDKDYEPTEVISLSSGLRKGKILFLVNKNSIYLHGAGVHMTIDLEHMDIHVHNMSVVKMNPTTLEAAQEFIKRAPRLARRYKWRKLYREFEREIWLTGAAFVVAAVSMCCVLANKAKHSKSQQQTVAPIQDTIAAYDVTQKNTANYLQESKNQYQ